MTIEPSAFDRSTELALVRGVLERKESAILEFTDRLRCVPRILSSQNARLGRPLDDHDLADLVQDTIVVILEKLGECEGRAPVEGWIYRVCCLELMNGVRRKRRGPRQLGPEEVKPAESEPEPLDLREQVLGALERVGGVEAEAVTLKHFEGLTFEEISRRLQVPTSTIKTRYYKGLSRLESILGSLEGEAESA